MPQFIIKRVKSTTTPNGLPLSSRTHYAAAIANGIITSWTEDKEKAAKIDSATAEKICHEAAKEVNAGKVTSEAVKEAPAPSPAPSPVPVLPAPVLQQSVPKQPETSPAPPVISPVSLPPLHTAPAHAEKEKAAPVKDKEKEPAVPAPAHAPSPVHGAHGHGAHGPASKAAADHGDHHSKAKGS